MGLSPFKKRQRGIGAAQGIRNGFGLYRSGYTFGSISALTMGAGMSLVMTDIGAAIGLTAAMTPGIIIGTGGMLMAIINYPLYKKILAGRKAKYAAQIMKLSDELINR